MANGAIFRGTGVAMITPFDNDGQVYYQQLESLTDHLIVSGVEYLVVLGTTAETPTLKHDEKLAIIDTVRKANGGRVPMIVGAGGNNTESVIDWIREIGTEGIDAYLSVAPYYNKPSQAGMIQHFSAIAAASDLPIVLYNVPGRTGSSIQAETTLTLAHEFGEKIIGIKEASGDFNLIMKVLKDKPEQFQVISGDDAIALPMVALGGDGVISVIGNALPAQFSTMVREALSGNYEAARDLHFNILPFIELIFREGNPTGVKALMELMGIVSCNLRLPLIPATAGLTRDLEKLLPTL